MAKKKKYSGFTGVVPNPEFESYKKGAVLGGILGAAAGLLSGSRIILYTFIGVLAGGYISYRIYNEDYKEGLKQIRKEEKNGK